MPDPTVARAGENQWTLFVAAARASRLREPWPPWEELSEEQRQECRREGARIARAGREEITR